MKAIWWKVRYCYFMWQKIRPRAKALWAYAGSAYDAHGADEAPRESVELETGPYIADFKE